MKLFKNFYLIFISMTLIFVSMLCGGCDKSEGKIDFSELQENSTINSIPEKTPLRIAFASVISPIDTRKSYHVLIDELSRQLDQAVVLIQKKTYEELNVLLANGEADIAFLSTGAYMSKAIREIAKGNYNISLDKDRNDETGRLIKAFNNMARRLSKKEKENSYLLAELRKKEEHNSLLMAQLFRAQEDERQHLSQELPNASVKPLNLFIEI